MPPLRRPSRYILLAALMLSMLCLPKGHAANDIAWVDPPAISIKRISSGAGAQSQPNFLSNLDCTLLSYRLANESTMRNGCFNAAAFGLVDTDSGHIIFNGTDEALNLTSYTGRQVLIPWPNALNLLAADTAATGGSYLSMYKNPLASIEEQRNYLGFLTGKRLKVPPELPLVDKQGNKLLVNLQTIAFSDGGSWMSAETLTGAFVRLNLATLDQLAFAPSYAQQGSAGMLNSSVAVRDDGRVIAIANDTATSLKFYTATDCASGQKFDICKNYDYWPYLKQKLPGLYGIRSVRFVNEALIKFEAWSTNSAESGTYLLAPSAQITSLNDYLAMGDSYTSGEGAFDYRTGTDTPENHCHTSASAYPELVTRELFSAAGGHSVACAGAVINDVGNRSSQYKGQVKGIADLEELQKSQSALLTSILLNHLPGYIAQHHFLKQDQPRIVSVSIGGNDIGFGDIVVDCVAPHLSIHSSANTCFNTYEDRLEVLQHIDRTVPRWTALFAQLAREAPKSTLYAIGYPDIVSDTGSCGVNVQLNQSEREFARELLSYLNASIGKAAAVANISYIDIGDALVGHRLCEAATSAIAVNGITAGKDSGILGVDIIGSESFHPNALGHQLIAQTILRKSANFTAGRPTSTPQTVDKGKLLDKPKINRPVKVRIPAKITEKKVASKKGKIRVTVNGVKVGLKPNTSYTVALGRTAAIIGTITSSPDGSLDAEMTIPDAASTDGTTIDIIGDNQNGQPVVVTQPIFIGDSPADTDGDGTPDSTDSCPTSRNSGIDTDGDGIDDICDGYIGATSVPATGQSNSTGSSTSGGNSNNASTPGSSAAATPVSGGQSGNSNNTGASVNGTISTLNPTEMASGKSVTLSASPASAAAISKAASTIKPTGEPTRVDAGPSLRSGVTRSMRLKNTSNTPRQSPERVTLGQYRWLQWFGLTIFLWWLLVVIIQCMYMLGRQQDRLESYAPSAS